MFKKNHGVKRSQKYISICFRVIIDRTEFVTVQQNKTNIFLCNTLVINVWLLLRKKRNLTQKILKVVTNILSTLLVKVSSIMEHMMNIYLCIRLTFLRKKSIMAQAGETSCDFGLDLSRPINFLSAFVRFLRFFTWSSYFCDNFDEPWSSSCFFYWDEFCLPRMWNLFRVFFR